MKKVITEIRRLTAKISLDFKEQLIHVFKGCGVALVFLPEVRGSFLHGITFEGENHKVVLGIGLRGQKMQIVSGSVSFMKLPIFCWAIFIRKKAFLKRMKPVPMPWPLIY